MALVNPLERFQGFIERNWKMRNGKSSMSNNFFGSCLLTNPQTSMKRHYRLIGNPGHVPKP